MLIETRSIDYVPLRERHGKVWHLWSVWFTGDAHLATVATGAIGVGLGLSLAWTALAVVLGGALGTFFMAFHSTQGPQLGLPQMIQSRPQFGHKGALLVWLVALVTFVGYNAFNLMLAADSLKPMGVEPHVTFVLFAVAAVAIAVIGHDWIHQAQRILAYLMIAILLVFTVGVFQRMPLPVAQLSPGPFLATPFLTQFFAAAAYQLSWSIYVSDYSRYLPRDVGVGASFLWTYCGAFIGGAWMMLVGSVVAAISPTLDVGPAVEAGGDAIFPGFGLALLLASLAGLVTIAAINFYGASLTLLSVADSFKPIRATPVEARRQPGAGGRRGPSHRLVLVGQFQRGVLGAPRRAALSLHALDRDQSRRFLRGAAAHYSVREIFNPDGMYGTWNWRGLLAYGVGFASMIPFFSTGLYTGPVAEMLGKADIAMVVGLPVSALVYLLACRSMDLAADRARAEAADRGLDPDEPAPLPAE